jgi:transcription antitermination factor NusG
VARAENSRWHAIHVRARFERVVALRLQDEVEESYLPLRRVVGRRHRSIHLPLFPGYVFCKCPSSVLSSVLMVPGVLSAFVGESIGGGISEQEIINLRRIMTAGVPSQPRPFKAEGRIVVVEKGPLSGVPGMLEQRAAKLFLIVSVEAIQRSIAVQIDQTCTKFGDAENLIVWDVLPVTGN